MNRYFLAAVLAVLAFATIGPFVKLLSPGVPLPLITFGRAFFGFVFVLLLVKKVHFRVEKFHWHDVQDYAFVGFLLAMTMSLFNYAFTLSPLSDVVVLNYAHVFISPVLAWILLRERMEKKTWWYIIAGFVGVAIVNPFSGHSWEGNLAALGAGLTYAMMAVYMRKVDKHHGLGDVAYFLGFAALFLFPFTFLTVPSFEISFTLSEWALIILSGVLSTGLGYFFFNYALEGLRVHVVSTMDLALGTLLGIILSVYAYQEPLSTNVLLGGLIIVGAGILFMRSQHVLSVRLKLPWDKTGIYATAFLSKKARRKR
jgi:drug/metabolite transporter (DMT)-like permease